MGLMSGSGPLGRAPAGTFNFSAPEPGQALYLEPTPKRVRVVVAGEVVADSRRAMMLHESGHQPIYYFPPEDVRSEFLEDSDRHTRCPKKGEASYYTIRVGDHVVDAGAWYYPDPIAGAPAIKDLIAFYFNRMDHWYEEDEEVFVHPRDPYHRVDVVRSDRHVRVSLDGQLLAESDRALALFESNLPRAGTSRPRTCSPNSSRPTRSPAVRTRGRRATTRSSSVMTSSAEDLVWYYAEPIAEAVRIKGLLCFFNERVDLELDGELQQRPESPWSRGVRSEAQNAEPAQTRG